MRGVIHLVLPKIHSSDNIPTVGRLSVLFRFIFHWSSHCIMLNTMAPNEIFIDVYEDWRSACCASIIRQPINSICTTSAGMKSLCLLSGYARKTSKMLVNDRQSDQTHFIYSTLVHFMWCRNSSQIVTFCCLCSKHCLCFSVHSSIRLLQWTIKLIKNRAAV